jgi:hypothetical protein
VVRIHESCLKQTRIQLGSKPHNSRAAAVNDIRVECLEFFVNPW